MSRTSWWRRNVVRTRTSLAALVVLALSSAPALAKPPSAKPTARVSPPASRRAPVPTRSVGSPTEGKLIGGAHLATSDYLRIVPVYVPGDVRWGTEPLVGLVDRAAKSVRKQFPDAVMSVGHLSKPGGGELDRHASHESGRDVDIGFYIKNHLGKPVYADHFVPFVPDGTAPTWPGAHFDDARNWALVASLVGDGRAHITHIFVATPIRQRLLAFAQKVNAPQNLRVRASQLMAQPRGALPHDDHFHVRIACPGGMEGCVELPTARRRPRVNAPAVAHVPAPAPRAVPHAAPPPPPPPPPKPRPAPRPKDEETTAMPSLAPIVPGYDSAVIPAPLSLTKPLVPAPAPAPQPAPPAIDDPDGILEFNH